MRANWNSAPFRDDVAKSERLRVWYRGQRTTTTCAFGDQIEASPLKSNVRCNRRVIIKKGAEAPFILGQNIGLNLPRCESQQMQREIAVILQREVKDPRDEAGDRFRCEGPPDLTHAKVYAPFGGDKDRRPGWKSKEELLAIFVSCWVKAMRLRVLPS